MQALRKRIDTLERVLAPQNPSSEDWIVKLGIIAGVRTGSPETDMCFTKLTLQQLSADEQVTLERAMKRRSPKPSYTAAEISALKAFEAAGDFFGDG